MAFRLEKGGGPCARRALVGHGLVRGEVPGLCGGGALAWPGAAVLRRRAANRARRGPPACWPTLPLPRGAVRTSCRGPSALACNASAWPRARRLDGRPSAPAPWAAVYLHWKAVNLARPCLGESSRGFAARSRPDWLQRGRVPRQGENVPGLLPGARPRPFGDDFFGQRHGEPRPFADGGDREASDAEDAAFPLASGALPCRAALPGRSVWPRGRSPALGRRAGLARRRGRGGACRLTRRPSRLVANRGDLYRPLLP